MVAAVGFEGEYIVSIGRFSVDPRSLNKRSLV